MNKSSPQRLHSQTKLLCKTDSCAQLVTHKRVGLCSICYKNKRRKDWTLNEVNRTLKDPTRTEARKQFTKQMYYSKYRALRLAEQSICRCGGIVLKGSVYKLCRQCSVRHSKDRKIKYQMQRKKEHLATKIRENIKSRMKTFLSGKTKGESIVTYLGISIPEYILYLESLFQSGMTWDNYGTMWHIDHIKAVKNFNTSELHVAFLYTNTQPLWVNEHVRKTAKENRSTLS